MFKRIEDSRVVLRCLDLDRQRLAPEPAIEVAAESDARCADESCSVHRVRDGVMNGGTAIGGEKLAVQIEANPTVAIANGGHLRIGQVTLACREQALRIGVRRNHARICRSKKVIERGPLEVRHVVQHGARIKCFDKSLPNVGEAACARIATGVAAAVAPTHAHHAQAAGIPQRHFVR